MKGYDDMASTSGKRASSSTKSKHTSNNKKTTTSRKNTKANQVSQDRELFHEIGLIILFVAMVILFLCNFGLIGPVGNTISDVLFGVFGFTAYIAPIVLFVGVAFGVANQGDFTAIRKTIAGIVLFVVIGIVCDLIVKNAIGLETYDVKAIYESCKINKNGGGIIAGSLAYLLHHYLETLGTVLVLFLLTAICIILLTEKSLLSGVKKSGSRIHERTREEAERRKEITDIRRLEQEEVREKREEIRRSREEQRRSRDEQRRLRTEEKENEKILRMNKKFTGVIMDTALVPTEDEMRRDDIHEITLNGEVEEVYMESLQPFDSLNSMDTINVHRDEGNVEAPEPVVERVRPQAKVSQKSQKTESTLTTDLHKDIVTSDKKTAKNYKFPPLSFLHKGKGKAGDSVRELKETALRLQQTLETFGVRVTVTDISQGPSVTRYELQPEQGVKVSKIVNLSDDIKLNLAATDIRIEAPIPGKAAVGIEVPNKENVSVALRDLLESKDFIEFPSNIAFAVGKDISGKVVVSDIAKMPHMLIAGATGSGKSVCINTLIMSILYKAHPDDVKLIMIDPKVVELSVYNGIPHLLIPVVTDPKKASAALHWGVTEMQERYKKFADFNVRDLKGFNEKVISLKAEGKEDAPPKMPQIVIIVDELADLMMVSPGEVEESICRLAQLARAAGIHLIIATQRPSVDVITGLIKANMPSRVAFSVSSGVDSRTILDMNGAEKLLGKGDMLFYPQGFSKPARVQGAFVSDKEVSDIVDFLKNQSLGNTYAEQVEEEIKSISSSSGGGSGTSANSPDSRDEYFADAGKFIIEKEKASIGMLQRVFKIGFNRAARIMDQLCDVGVVGEEEGTKPRKVLMSQEQFEQLLEEI